MSETKKCSVCKECKPLEMFNKLSTAKTGRTSSCKACKSTARLANKDHIAAQKKAWYEDNKDIIAIRTKEDRKSNPDKYHAKEKAKYDKNKVKIAIRVQAYQRENRDVYRRAGHKYRKTHPHLACAKAARRRAIKLQATPLWAASEFDTFFIQEVYHLAELRRLAGIGSHVDHIVPLVSKKVCGLHCAANLQVLTVFENESKGNRYWPDMWLDTDY